MDIELVIDELVLHGIDARDRYAVADALRLELTRLLSTPGHLDSLQANSDVATLSLPQVTLPAGGQPASVGTEVAAAVYQGLPG
jgi:hypothetical protein